MLFAAPLCFCKKINWFLKQYDDAIVSSSYYCCKISSLALVRVIGSLLLITRVVNNSS